MDLGSLRLMKDRRYELLPVDRIVVLNSRNREEERFGENVKSIETVGLLKPVLVNERFLPTSGNYELVCGEGRLLAHRRLGKPQIAAEVIDCDRKYAYLISLIENIARVPPRTIWFAREIKRLRDAGMTYPEISRIVGKSEAMVAGYVSLVEKGEERLLRGVEQGIFSITFALQVAESDQAQIQNLLMDAFDQGMVTSANLRRVRKIIEERTSRPGTPRKASPAEESSQKEEYTVEELKRDLQKTTREKQAFVRETARKEGRLVSLIEGLKVLRSSEGFMNLLKAEGLAELPALEGCYSEGSAKSEVIHHG
jgi:ParB family chromosome partitioning protein